MRQRLLSGWWPQLSAQVNFCGSTMMPVKCRQSQRAPEKPSSAALARHWGPFRTCNEKGIEWSHTQLTLASLSNLGWIGPAPDTERVTSGHRLCFTHVSTACKIHARDPIKHAERSRDGKKALRRTSRLVARSCSARILLRTLA